MANSVPGVPPAGSFSDRGGSSSWIFSVRHGLRDVSKPEPHPLAQRERTGDSTFGLWVTEWRKVSDRNSRLQLTGVQIGQAIGLELGIEPGLDAGESVLAQPARFLRVVDQRDHCFP
jgi:hypothetical protein